MSPAEARGWLADLCGLTVRDGQIEAEVEYKNVLLDKRASAQAGAVVDDVFERLAFGLTITPEEHRTILKVLNRLVDEDEAWATYVEAFRVAAVDNRRLYKQSKVVARGEIAKYGRDVAAARTQNFGLDVMAAFNDAADEYDRRAAPDKLPPAFMAGRVLIRNPRMRESRPRRTRSSRSRASPSRLAGDDPEPPLDPPGPVAG
jgi:hypothetical protein